jgi:hypothetical protein
MANQKMGMSSRSARLPCSHFQERTATVTAMIVTQMNTNWKTRRLRRSSV